MILTRLGWSRSPHKARVRQREATSKLPTVFRCTCKQCACGCVEMVMVGGATICKGCGVPHERPRHLWVKYGRYWDAKSHQPYCNKNVPTGEMHS